MQIYFAGAIRGGRQDASTYHAMIAHLQTHAEVLTEHVGNKALSDGGEHDLSDDQIHARDMAWLVECDAVVAEVTTPSLGVGYELGVAEKLGNTLLAPNGILGNARGMPKEIDEKCLSAVVDVVADHFRMN